MWTSVILAALVIVFIFYVTSRRPEGFPPGPTLYPIVGNSISLIPDPLAAFERFRKKFGDVVGFKAFGRRVVLISDPTLMKEASSDLKVSGRPDFYLFLSRNELISGKEQPLGIIGTWGEPWRHQRRFTLRSLRDQGFGKHSIEPIMQSELQELGDYFVSKSHQKITIGNSFNRSIINVIWAMIVGNRFSYDDHRLQDLVDKVNKMIQYFNPFHPALNYRIIKKLMPNLDIYKKVDGNMKELLVFMQEQIDVYMKEMDNTNDPGSYLGMYLKEIKDSSENGNSPFNTHHLKANMIELFIAGSETTATTLWWSIYFMVTNLDVQKKVQQELSEVLGVGNNPNLDHIDQLPYTLATLYEVQRRASVLPNAIPHRTLEDTTIGGYRIPNDTDVLLNLNHIFSSPKYWKHPEKFYPEHFLTPDGKVHKPDAFLPFGFGKRVCLGESLARLELFLFFSNLMQRFSWSLSEDPVTWETATVVTRPPNFTVRITERSKA